VLNIFLLVVGMTMDIFSAIVVVVPLIVPIANHFDMNPYHLGAIFLLNLEIGYLTPPFGLNLFISSFRFERSVPTVYRAVVPFTLLLLGVLALVTFVPQLSTWSSRLAAPLLLGPPPTETSPPADELRVDDAPGDPGSSGETLEDLLGSQDGAAPPAGETLEDLLGPGDDAGGVAPGPGKEE
jgi:hypothetical protein